VITNVLYNISVIFTLVSHTVKVFVACWGYYWCVLWNLNGTSRVISWFKWDRSIMYPVEVHVWVHMCVCVCVRVCGKIVIVHMLPVIVFPYEVYREELEKWFYLRWVEFTGLQASIHDSDINHYCQGIMI
jgi:hypothetical protein